MCKTPNLPPPIAYLYESHAHFLIKITFSARVKSTFTWWSPWLVWLRYHRELLIVQNNALQVYGFTCMLQKKLWKCAEKKPGLCWYLCCRWKPLYYFLYGSISNTWMRLGKRMVLFNALQPYTYVQNWTWLLTCANKMNHNNGSTTQILALLPLKAKENSSCCEKWEEQLVYFRPH